MAIVVINRFGTPPIDSHCLHQKIWKEFRRYIWSAAIDFGVGPQQTSARTKLWETGLSIGIADNNRKGKLVIDGHLGRQYQHLLQQILLLLQKMSSIVQGVYRRDLPVVFCRGRFQILSG